VYVRVGEASSGKGKGGRTRVLNEAEKKGGTRLGTWSMKTGELAARMFRGEKEKPNHPAKEGS